MSWSSGPKATGKGPAAAILFSALLVSTAASAAAEIRFDGNYELRFNANTNYLLDPSQRLDQTAWAEHRLRLTPKIVDQERIEIQAQFDVVSGLIAGDLAPTLGLLGWTERSERNGIRARGFDFRYLFVTLRLPVGVFQLGQFPNNWGMGLLNNSGEFMEGFDFGDQRFGDIVDGFLFGTRPLAFLGPRSELARQVAAGISGQIVYRDRYASLVTRTGGGTTLAGTGLTWADVALQGVFFARWEPTDLSRVGVYVSRRAQSYAADGGNLQAWIFDAHARTAVLFPSLDSSLRLETEGVAVSGHSTHAMNLNTDSVRVVQQGLVARATVTRRDVEAELEVGYASGDSNPFDDVSSGFMFNRDYKVGLVLWDEVMLFQTQNSARKLSDPALSAIPPHGIDLLATEGAVTNALYLNPKLRWRPPILSGRLRGVVGVLFTRAPEPVIDPYQSFLASAPRNAFGQPAGQSYGTEVDLGLSFRQSFTDDRQLGLVLDAQYGVLFPGDVFRRADGSTLPPVQALRLRTTFYF
jgi:hypothetical protein